MKKFTISAAWDECVSVPIGVHDSKFWVGMKPLTGGHGQKTLFHDCEFVDGRPNTCAETVNLRLSSKTTCMDVADNGLGVSASGETIKAWESASGKVLRELAGHVADVYDVKFFPSGLVVLSCGADMRLRIWSVETGVCARTITGHTQAVLCASPVGKGHYVASGSRDGSCRLWNCGTANCVWSLSPGQGPINDLAVGHASESADASQPMIVLVTETGALVQGDARQETPAAVAPASGQQTDNTPLTTLCLCPDDRLLCCGTQNGHVLGYDFRNMSKPLWDVDLDSGAIEDVAIADSNHRSTYVSTADGTVLRLNNANADSAPSPNELPVTHWVSYTGSDCDPVYRVVPRGEDLFTCCRDGIIRRYDADSS